MGKYYFGIIHKYNICCLCNYWIRILDGTSELKIVLIYLYIQDCLFSFNTRISPKLRSRCNITI